MALNVEEKDNIIKKHSRSENDTGSPEVQVALLTADIEKLSSHFKAHDHDHHSRRGLLRKVSQRRKLLSYLKDNNTETYQALIKELGLRR